MSFSTYLSDRKDACQRLVTELRRSFEYVSILGTDVRSMNLQVNRRTSAVNEGGDAERGFVLKLYRDGLLYEYSTDTVDGDTKALAEHIRRSLTVDARCAKVTALHAAPADEPLCRDFERPTDLDAYTEGELLDEAKELRDRMLAHGERVLNAFVVLRTLHVSKLFVSEHRLLTQSYAWVNGILMVLYREGERTVQTHEMAAAPTLREVTERLPERVDVLLHKASCLTRAVPVTPGVYDVITAPSITGLIAHEAFGHGVEMDMFVKDRALAKSYMGDYVASPIVNMRDGAAATVSAASYFFDDDGVLAHDTQIIKDGILVAGISDLVSAGVLGTEPTGNGRRESYKRKAYARMTNTFFEAGHDRLEDMIASIEHGYMIFETNNGMEDPKNWAIQCVAEYGIEIEHGKLTDRYVSPVVMSGYVPELLQSISMISDTVEVIGAGSCGKGHKEWVRVSDGGPALKVRVKLG